MLSTNGASVAPHPEPPAAAESALDAYSRTVIAVAESLGPSVANLQVRRRSRRGSAVGAGSGVVISGDGLLVTSAHVVEGARRGMASFADGRETPFAVVGSDPLSDLAVLRARDGSWRTSSRPTRRSIRATHAEHSWTAPRMWSASTRPWPGSDSGWPCRSTRRRARSSAP